LTTAVASCRITPPTGDAESGGMRPGRGSEEDDAAPRGGRLDLSEDSAFLLTLIDRPLDWRERLVEEFSFERAAHVSVASSYQINFPPDLLEGFADSTLHRTANVLLPLTTRDKRPLLNLAITGPAGAPAQLLSRASTAALEAQYLSRLIRTSEADAQLLRGGLPENLLEAICVFTPDYFNSIADGADGVDVAMYRYLVSGLGADMAVTPETVRRWRALTAEATGILRSHAAWLPVGRSSAEEPLLALPRLDPLPGDIDEIETIVSRFCDAVSALERAGDDVLLRALAEYGRRYELIVEVELPLLEPCTVKVTEDRVLRERTRGWTTQTFRLGDARSAHLEARAADPNVVLENFDVRGIDGEQIGLGPLESVRRTEETLALYSAETERPEYVEVSLQLRPRRHLRWTSTALTALNGLTVVVAIFMPHDHLLVERLALLTVPTTLAATVVLVREQTALATRLQTASRLWLGGSTVVLWCVVLAMLLTFHPKEPTGSARTGSVTVGQVLSGARLDEEVMQMARNGQRGNGRVGTVRDRSQTRNPQTGLWTKRDTSTGRFLDVKKSGGTFRGVRREK
jgi:hypothetical protein